MDDSGWLYGESTRRDYLLRLALARRRRDGKEGVCLAHCQLRVYKPVVRATEWFEAITGLETSELPRRKRCVSALQYYNTRGEILQSIGWLGGKKRLRACKNPRDCSQNRRKED